MSNVLCLQCSKSQHHPTVLYESETAARRASHNGWIYRCPHIHGGWHIRKRVELPSFCRSSS